MVVPGYVGGAGPLITSIRSIPVMGTILRRYGRPMGQVGTPSRSTWVHSELLPRTVIKGAAIGQPVTVSTPEPRLSTSENRWTLAIGWMVSGVVSSTLTGCSRSASTSNSRHSSGISS